MRLALLIERFEPGAGGVENVAWMAAHGLARAGEEVHVVARRAARSTQVQIHRVSAPRFWQPIRVLSFSRACSRLASRERFDVVYSYSRTLHQDVFRSGAGSHADYLERRHRGAARALRRLSPRHALLCEIERRVFADPRQLVQCNSAMVEREIQRRFALPPARSCVIHNGVDLERYHPRNRDDAGRRLRAELGGGDGPVWLLAGADFARKGLDTALRALALAGDDSGQLWIAGGDEPRPWRARAEALGVEARVRFLGRRSDLASVYAAADALLLPTRYDAFANVCFEAAASGLPVVTSGANGAADLLRAAGRVVEDAEDVPGFAAALSELGNARERERLGLLAREIAEAHSWQSHVAALRKLFAQVRR